MLATVFSTSRGDGSEVPFAIGRTGQLYTRNDADRARVEALGSVAKVDGPATARLADWIVVTTPDPSGSGLKLGIARPVGDSLANLRRTAARNAGLGALFIAVALIGIVPLSGRLTRGLTTLSEGVNRIAQGDYSTRVPIRATTRWAGSPSRSTRWRKTSRSISARRWSRSASSASSSSGVRSRPRCCRTGRFVSV